METDLINTGGMFDSNHGGTIIEVSNSQDILSITTTETELKTMFIHTRAL